MFIRKDPETLLFESQAMYCYQKRKASAIYTFLNILNISWEWLISEDAISELPTKMSEEFKLQYARYVLKSETLNSPIIGFDVKWQKKIIVVMEVMIWVFILMTEIYGFHASFELFYHALI